MNIQSIRFFGRTVALAATMAAIALAANSGWATLGVVVLGGYVSYRHVISPVWGVGKYDHSIKGALGVFVPVFPVLVIGLHLSQVEQAEFRGAIRTDCSLENKSIVADRHGTYIAEAWVCPDGQTHVFRKQ